jgi:hypothetical protein
MRDPAEMLLIVVALGVVLIIVARAFAIYGIALVVAATPLPRKSIKAWAIAADRRKAVGFFTMARHAVRSCSAH